MHVVIASPEENSTHKDATFSRFTGAADSSKTHTEELHDKLAAHSVTAQHSIAKAEQALQRCHNIWTAYSCMH